MQRQHGPDSDQLRDLQRRMPRPSERGHARLIGLLALGWFAVACGSAADDAGTGGSAPGTGGTGLTGGSSATGGLSSEATGGFSAGGTSATGGATATGGTNTSGPTGGTSTTGGSTATGGTNTSGPTGGTSATGGATATGGTSTGGRSAGGTSTGGTSAGGGSNGGTSAGGTSTGGTTGTGGDATGGGSAGGPVTPEKVSDSDYRFTVGNVVLDANPQVGGRITSLTIDNKAILKAYTCTSYDPNGTCNSSGSTIWTSPQSVWGWPPLTAIDGGPYAATVNDNHLVMKGSPDTTKVNAGITKDISADSSTGWITMTFTIDATQAISAALWQISRVPRGGLACFPVVTMENGYPSWQTSESGGIEWVDDSKQTSVVSEDGSKIVADGSGGWLAYVLGGNLFLIKYPDVKAADFAEDEGDIEIYPGNGFIELEVQGPNQSIAANASSAPWTVQWRVAPVPSTVTVGVGEATLTDFITQQVAM
ncbi:MAG: hypothetical protein JW940_24225 [Polyangiaceae bacterium]|nr:hypothetical protein [Polyangiaceae bacterium]